MTAPDGLQTRGKLIWDAYGAGELPASSQAMVHELCRLADALDRFDGILTGARAEWVKVVDVGDGEVTLEINNVLGERRQYALAFKVLYAELRAAGVKENTEAKPQTEGREGLILSLVQSAG